MNIKLITVIGLISIVVLGAAAPVFATDSKLELKDTLEEARQKVQEVENLDDSASTTVNNLSSMSKSQENRIAEHKNALMAQIEAARDEHKAMLEGRRLERCENREDVINKLIDKSTALGKKHLAHLQRFEANIKKFYEKKDLSSDTYSANLATADEKEAAAIAALDVMAAEDYDCSAADGSKPANEIHMLRKNRREALGAYRDALKDLISSVLAAFRASKSDSGA